MSLLLIGIAGPSAGGKTTVTQKIMENFSDSQVTLISYDDYYKDQSHLTRDERKLTNYDHPKAFDTDLLVEHLTDLIKGKKIQKPIYDFTVNNRSKQTETLEPSNIIIVEGLFTLYEKQLRDLIDVKVYVEADADECFIRRLIRDRNERGRSTQSVIDQYLTTVKPMQERFIEPTRKFADVIVLRGGENGVAIEMVSQMINKQLEKGDLWMNYI